MALFNSSESAQVYTPAFVKQTGPSFSIWGWAANIAAGVRPADPRYRLPNEGRSRPRTREQPARNHKTPSRTRLRRQATGPRRGERGNQAQSRPRGSPSVQRLYYSYHFPTTLTPSYKPQAGQLHELDTSSRTSQHRTSPSRTTWTRHKREWGTKAPQPRVQRGGEGATLGILSLLGSRYHFQGWQLQRREV